MKRKYLTAVLASCTLFTLSACGSNEEGLKVNVSYGNAQRTITFNQASTLTLEDGTTYVAGDLKPMWASIEDMYDMKLIDSSISTQSAAEMMTQNSTNGFVDADIFGGNSIADELMNQGVSGHFLDLTPYLEDELVDFGNYLKANPTIQNYITATDGSIYYIPYIAELGTVARSYHSRTDWVELLLDGTATYDTASLSSSGLTLGVYKGFYGTSYSRPEVYPQASSFQTENSPTTGTGISRNNGNATTNIITLQNNLGSNATPTQLAQTLITYINENYDYENPSELYVGANAAYDIDEMVALYRVIKANPKLLSGNDGITVNEVFPFFTRQGDYREDLLRFATYFDGAHSHGSDSYAARWMIDENGDLQYTYTSEEMFDVLEQLSQIYNEGLVYQDCLVNDKTSHRTALYGTDNSESPKYGFMTFDWIGSTTADSLNDGVDTMLPPVANVNGTWQYYIENSRVVKPDGWSIASHVASDEDKLQEALTLFNHFFTEEGNNMANYGPQEFWEKEVTSGNMPSTLDPYKNEDGTYDVEVIDGYYYAEDSNGKWYPIVSEWTVNATNEKASGDMATFLRDWVGGIMAVGYVKEEGLEIQYTSGRGLEGINMLNQSTVTIPTYGGENKFDNIDNRLSDYYYTLIPPVFAFTKTENTQVTQYTPSDEAMEIIFNIIKFHALGGTGASGVYANSYEELQTYFSTNTDIAQYIVLHQRAYDRVMGKLD